MTIIGVVASYGLNGRLWPRNGDLSLCFIWLTSVGWVKMDGRQVSLGLSSDEETGFNRFWTNRSLRDRILPLGQNYPTMGQYLCNKFRLFEL